MCGGVTSISLDDAHFSEFFGNTTNVHRFLKSQTGQKLEISLWKPKGMKLLLSIPTRYLLPKHLKPQFPQSQKIKDVPASWLTLPKKRQLIFLALCRLVEPISQTSVLSYLYYFFHSLNPSLPPATLSRQAGYLVFAFAVCMFLTGWFWGRVKLY